MRSIRLGLALVSGIALIALASAGSAAAEQTTTTTTPAAESTDTSASNDEASATTESTDEDRPNGLSYAALGFGVVLGFGLLTYLYLVQKEFFSTEREALRRTQAVVPTRDVNALVLEALVAEPPAQALEIEGPDAVTVGVEAEYTVQPPTTGGPLSNVAWTVTASDAATADPAQGAATTKIKALKANTFTLEVQASLADGTQAGGRHTITAAEPAGEPAGLPFVGAGYGTVLLAIALLSILAVLGLTDVLGGDVVATLLGTIAGYIFVKTASEAGAGAGTSGASGTTDQQPRQS